MKNSKRLCWVLPLITLASCSLTISGGSSSLSTTATSSSTVSEASSSTNVSSSSEISSSTESEPTSTSSLPSIPGYSLAWSDEFDGDALDTDSWSIMTGNGSNYGIYDWGNNEKENYQGDNISLKDGNLVIEAKAEETMIGNSKYSYTSGRIRSLGKISTTYGRIEASISLPAIRGTWPAFWMLPERGSWPKNGEIDIMENGGSDTVTSSALHYANNNGHTYVTDTHVFSKRTDNTTTVDYHTYAVEWDEEGLNFFVDKDNLLSVPKRTYHPDGGTVYTSDDDAPFNAPFHILFNMAIGGNYVGGALPPSDFSSCQMKVDYVRIYDAI